MMPIPSGAQGLMASRASQQKGAYQPGKSKGKGKDKGSAQRDTIDGMPWARQGDWQCPNDTCKNYDTFVFGSKTSCPSCGSLKPDSARAAPY
jgi:hypothetical protein